MSPPKTLEPGDAPQVHRTSRLFKRSRRGCWTCRSPRVKKRCDEQRPVCGRCSRLNLSCDFSARPSLAERRKARQIQIPRQEDVSTSLKSFVHGQGISCPQYPSLSVLRITPPATSASSLTLRNEDHEAIHFFRTATARSHHTKTPGFGLFSIMFDIARVDPMVMHMVIAVGKQEMAMELCRANAESNNIRRDPLRHYTLALGMMATAISPGNESQDLDVILTALWLMLLYEQQFGDSECKVYTKHLAGASSLLQHRAQALQWLAPMKLDSTRESKKEALVFSKNSVPGKSRQLSMYSARILLWITVLDTAAASMGVGGQVTKTLVGNMFGYGDAESITSMEAFCRFHRFSNPLYRLHWGEAYPQSELLDDAQNRNIYALLGQCTQLRFLTARLGSLFKTDAVKAAREARDVEIAIEEVGYSAAESLEIASCLSPRTDNSQRLVANIRAIVPLYHAVVLSFLRLTRFNEPLDNRQRNAIREITNLAHQSYKHDGDEAMNRISWPLFISALETDDVLHQEWILDRFAGIRKYGKNFIRAHQFLVAAITGQRRDGARIDLLDHLEGAERFVLS